MYGGHITDNWDRRTNNMYLSSLLHPRLFDGGDIGTIKGFKSITEGLYKDYSAHVDTLSGESPVFYGLHSNAEIGYLTGLNNALFAQFMDVSGSVSGGGEGQSEEDTVKSLLQDYLDQLPPDFNMADIMERVQEKSPYLVVMLQECERMNVLLTEIRRSLNELKLGLEGALNISDAMELLQKSLFQDRVPASWTKAGYPSLKSLQPWYNNLLERVDQMHQWSESLQTPRSVWTSGLFNPMAFLTAVMQVTARSRGWPLDLVTIITKVTSKLPEQVDEQPEEGAHIHGLFCEGARWDMAAGCVKDSRMKELHPPMPVIQVLAVPVEDGSPKGEYPCPVYYTAMRGPTFMFKANLVMDKEDTEEKWTLAALALLMNVE